MRNDNDRQNGCFEKNIALLKNYHDFLETLSTKLSHEKVERSQAINHKIRLFEPAKHQHSK